MNRRNILASVLAGVTVLTLVGGCRGANQRDLNGIPSKDPDKAEVYTNVDQHPNIVRLCIGGVAFATISRQYNSILRVPEWDAWCKS